MTTPNSFISQPREFAADHAKSVIISTNTYPPFAVPPDDFINLHLVEVGDPVVMARELTAVVNAFDFRFIRKRRRTICNPAKDQQIERYNYRENRSGHR